jgi:hypothetical protein
MPVPICVPWFAASRAPSRELPLGVNDSTALLLSVHPSWCSMGDVALESRLYVLLGSCR